MYRTIYEKALNTNGLLYNNGLYNEKFIKCVSDSGSMQFKNKEELCNYFDIDPKIYGDNILDDILKGRNLRLLSSALLAFLFFHNLQGKKVKIPGLEQFGELTISEVYFEQSNSVFRAPSQIDVAILCNDNIIIYLESKFSEYLNGIKSSKLSEDYECDLRNIFGDKFQETLTINSSWFPKKCFSTGNGLRYGEGIKQMIAHIKGVHNGPTDKNKLKDTIKGGKCTIVLGEIVYEFGPDVDKKESLSSYSEAYEWLIKEVKKTITTDRSGNEIILLPKLLTYQELLKSSNLTINEKIKSFYKF